MRLLLGVAAYVASVAWILAAFRIAVRPAPSAMRIAISLVRCETRNKMTLYTPAADMITASSAKAPMSSTWNRGSVIESAIISSMVMTPKTGWSEIDD